MNIYIHYGKWETFSLTYILKYHICKIVYQQFYISADNVFYINTNVLNRIEDIGIQRISKMNFQTLCSKSNSDQSITQVQWCNVSFHFCTHHACCRDSNYLVRHYLVADYAFVLSAVTFNIVQVIWSAHFMQVWLNSCNYFLFQNSSGRCRWKSHLIVNSKIKNIVISTLLDLLLWTFILLYLLSTRRLLKQKL